MTSWLDEIMKYPMPCGCVHDGRRWLHLCGPEKPGEDHAGQQKELHERAMAEHFAKKLDQEAKL